MTFNWTVVDPDSHPEPTPDEVAWRLRAERNRRFQCLCGRFVKKSTYRDHGMDLIGSRTWSWVCSRCGEVTDGT